MKQIIVNVSGLTIEEKQRVNEALAKITGFNKMSLDLVKANWMYAPSSYANDEITLSYGNKSYENKEPTHTPQQVLEMAGMTTKRKVRKDFDLTKEYSVDVCGCTEEEKNEVQQAFFDVGLFWSGDSKTPSNMGANYYTNTMLDGTVDNRLLFGDSAVLGVMSPSQFLAMVYEPEQQGHVHAVLMAQYAEDAKTTDKPWELWQFKDCGGNWKDLRGNPSWHSDAEYRRKPKTHTVNGVEVPDLRIEPKAGDSYYLVNPTEPEFFNYEVAIGNKYDSKWIERGLCYEDTEEGKQAAILHAKAWLGIA